MPILFKKSPSFLRLINTYCCFAWTLSQEMQAVGITYRAVFEQMMAIDWPSRITRDKAIAFVQSLVRKRHMENTDPLEYTDMAKNYFVLKLGEKYRAITKPLIDAGILQSTKYYRPGYHNDEGFYIKGQCLSYRINPELLDDEVIKVIYEGESKKQKCRDEVTMRSKQLLRQVRIPDLNSRQLIAFVKTSLTDERIRKMLKVNEEVTDSIIQIKGHSHPIPLSKVQRRTRDLIQDGKYCYIEHLHIYIARKRRHLTQAYCDQLLRIKHRNVYADRNETNLRLDSNLTNLKSDFIGLLSIDGQRLSQVDLKNSQFRFFIYLLEQCERKILFGNAAIDFPAAKFSAAAGAKLDNTWEGGKEKEIDEKFVTLLCVKFDELCIDKRGSTPSFTTDYSLFKKLGKTGGLYEYIQKIYWDEKGVKISRKEAKKMMFTIAFSAYRYQPECKQLIKKHFPSVIGLIDAYKRAMCDTYADDATITPVQAREKGNASFAVMLQQTESLVFIDRILAECHKRNIKALSKHDSILCRQCDRHIVTKVICKVLNKIFGKWTYSLDIDGKVFTLQEKKKSRMKRFVNNFVHTLFGLEYRANGPPTLWNERLKMNAEVAVCDVPGTDDVDVLTDTHVQTGERRQLSARVEALRKRIMGG